MKIIKTISILIILGLQVVNAENYELPPTSRSYGNAPVISDEAMEKCVKLYNEAKWLGDEINNMYVDRYSQSSVNKYNSKISKHSKMINFFNKNCAGKQSESAYRAAKKLNNGIGIRRE